MGVYENTERATSFTTIRSLRQISSLSDLKQDNRTDAAVIEIRR